MWNNRGILPDCESNKLRRIFLRQPKTVRQSSLAIDFPIFLMINLFLSVKSIYHPETIKISDINV